MVYFTCTEQNNSFCILLRIDARYISCFKKNESLCFWHNYPNIKFKSLWRRYHAPPQLPVSGLLSCLLGIALQIEEQVSFKGSSTPHMASDLQKVHDAVGSVFNPTL